MSVPHFNCNGDVEFSPGGILHFIVKYPVPVSYNEGETGVHCLRSSPSLTGPMKIDKSIDPSEENPEPQFLHLKIKWPRFVSLLYPWV